MLSILLDQSLHFQWKSGSFNFTDLKEEIEKTSKFICFEDDKLTLVIVSLHPFKELIPLPPSFCTSQYYYFPPGVELCFCGDIFLRN